MCRGVSDVANREENKERTTRLKDVLDQIKWAGLSLCPVKNDQRPQPHT